jgi:hypothetical protein
MCILSFGVPPNLSYKKLHQIFYNNKLFDYYYPKLAHLEKKRKKKRKNLEN